MNYNKLSRSIQEKIFTDVTIILSDKSHQIIINAHKIILYTTSVYFEKLLTTFKEKHDDVISIEVPNAYIAYDVIMSFYGQQTNLGKLSPNKHLLESIKCKYYFGLDIDESLLNGINVSEEDFELFLDIIDLIGYNERTIKLINKNLPEIYDLSKFPKELLNEMLELSKIYYIISSNKDSITIWNALTYKLVRTFDNYYDILNICYSPNNKHIASSDNGHIQIRNITTGELVCSFDIIHIDGLHPALSYSPDGQRITFVPVDPDNNSIQILNIEPDFINKNIELDHTIKIIGGRGNYYIPNRNHNPIAIWPTTHTDIITDICYSPDGQYIASASRVATIKIWDTQRNRLKYTLDNDPDAIYCICWTLDSKYIASGDLKGNVKIWNIETVTFVTTLVAHVYAVLSICYSYDNKYIAASGSFTHNIKIWNTETYQLVNILFHHDMNVFNTGNICFSHNDEQIVSMDNRGMINIWSIQTGKVIKTLNCPLIFEPVSKSNICKICYAVVDDDKLKKRIMEINQ